MRTDTVSSLFVVRPRAITKTPQIWNSLLFPIQHIEVPSRIVTHFCPTSGRDNGGAGGPKPALSPFYVGNALKGRRLFGFRKAAAQIIKAIGIGLAAQLAGRSPSLVYKWADSEVQIFPNLKQALELDLEFARDHPGMPPFLAAYMVLLKDGFAQHANRNVDILPEIVRLVSLSCEVLQAIVAQRALSNQTRTSRTPTKCNVCVSLREIAEIESAISWRIKSDPNELTCPLRTRPEAEVACGLTEAD